MRPHTHLLGVLHALLLLSGIPDTARASDSSPSTGAPVAAPPFPASSRRISPLDLPAHCLADPWRQLRPQCAADTADLVLGSPPLPPPAETPPGSGPPDLDLGVPEPEPEPDELESFEEWKRRKEAEDALPVPPESRTPRGENRSAPVGTRADTDSRVNTSGADANVSTPDGGGAGDAAITSGSGAGSGSGSGSVSGSPPGVPQAAPPGRAGGHRYNYASPDCSARVLAASPSTQHASSLLHKSKDRYMLTPCRADEHWVVVELCDEIRVEALELAVWEFFSGIVRSVRVSVGDDAAAGASWTPVGEFVGKNVRGAQTFTLPEPTSFHRFLRLDFPSFYGNEYYCPVSQLKVYGMNQMEAFKMEQRRAAEVSGAKSREREEAERDREQERERERDAEMERQRVAAEAAALSQQTQQRAEDERKERELCELERLVQEQARRAGILMFEQPSECPPPPPPPEPAAESSTMAGTNPSAGANSSSSTAAGASSDAGTGTAATDTYPPPSASPSSTTTYTAPTGPRTDSSESIYAFIIRRLNALEGNSTLVARYIDEQTKALRAALTRAETRWEVARILAAKEEEVRWSAERLRTEERLSRLGARVEALHSAAEAERRATQRQLRVLADELGFERRKSLAQLVVLVIAIVLGVLSRGDSIDALLRTLANDGPAGASRRPRMARTASKNQKRLSTGPLAGLLIDIESPPSSTNPGTNPSTPTQPQTSPTMAGNKHLPHFRGNAQLKPARRQLAPPSSRRRTHTPSRSFSGEAALGSDGQASGPSPFPLPDEDELLSPAVRSVLAQRAGRRIARSAHLHPIRRRGGDESSEAEGHRPSSFGTVGGGDKLSPVAQFHPFQSYPNASAPAARAGPGHGSTLGAGPSTQARVHTQALTHAHTSHIPLPHTHLAHPFRLTPLPAATTAAAAVAAVRSGQTVAPEVEGTEDGASAPDSADSTSVSARSSASASASASEAEDELDLPIELRAFAARAGRQREKRGLVDSEHIEREGDGEGDAEAEGEDALSVRSGGTARGARTAAWAVDADAKGHLPDSDPSQR